MRKKVFAGFSLAVIAIFATMSTVHASSYDITRITYGTGTHPDINNNGDMVWKEWDWDTHENEIVFYNGSTATRLTDNDTSDGDPHISDNGDIVWQGWDTGMGQIYRYRNSTTTNISESVSFPSNALWPQNHSAQINSNGDVVWRSQYNYPSGQGNDLAQELYFFNGSAPIKISDTLNCDEPIMNENGHVIWNDETGIKLYNGSTTSHITGTNFHDYRPDINNNGQIVWEHYVGGGIADVYFSDGVNPAYALARGGLPQINDLGQIGWVNNGDMFFYNGTDIMNLSASFGTSSNGHFQMNNNGLVVWSGYLPGGLAELFVYDGTDKFQLTSGGYASSLTVLNDQNQIAFSSTSGDHYGIYVANPTTVAPVPEPMSLLLLGSGLLGLAGLDRKKG